MSFARPLLLLTLFVIPLAVALYVLAERRRMKFAIRFTNVDVLAGVVGSRFRRRFVPLALFLLAIAALCVGMARPQHSTLVPRDPEDARSGDGRAVLHRTRPEAIEPDPRAARLTARAPARNA